MNYPFKRQCKDYADKIFKDYGEKIQIYLSAGKSKSQYFDKYRNIGYDIIEQPPIIVKAIVSDVKANELIMKQLGLVEIGAKKLTIRESDIQFFKVSKKIIYKNEEFYVFNSAVGNKLQIQIGDLGYATIIIFQRPDK